MIEHPFEKLIFILSTQVVWILISFNTELVSDSIHFYSIRFKRKKSASDWKESLANHVRKIISHNEKEEKQEITSEYKIKGFWINKVMQLFFRTHSCYPVVGYIASH